MLTKEQKKYLRTLSHDLKTIIWVGQNGLNENVMQEINYALDHHELVKIKIRAGDRKLREQTATEIRESTGSETIQKIGNVISLYRQNKQQPRIKLPV